ncbi:uncharacterized protein [Euwallacea fornicatus]|uniref:uncharacterized protein isoform X3 n=1 Tax=Euwallacea fornicatus TaxID=995702 RepID=UPI0033904591
MLNILLQSFALTFFLSSSHAQDWFQPKSSLPQEVNDFLNNVQQHKRDFAFIRHAVKNQKEYNKYQQEARGLLADNVENQMKLDSDIGTKSNDEGNSFSDLVEDGTEEEKQHDSYNEEEGTIYAGFEAPRFQKHYPNERYSRNIHSPIRFKRQLKEGFRSKHKLNMNPNGQFGYIKKTDQKYPSKSHEEKHHVMKVDEEGATKKKKRKVEISIISNGKLLKHVEDNEDGPKSIVLKINALVSQNRSENSTMTKNNNPFSSESRENIPNISDNPPNKNNGVPINFLPKKNNLNISRTLGEVLPEVGKEHTSHQAVVKPLNATFNDLKRSGQNSHMTKSIYMAQSNFSSKKHELEYELNEDKRDNFEKAHDLVVYEPGVSEAQEKFLIRENQGYNYFDPQDFLGLVAGFSKKILPATTPEFVTSEKQKAENILHVENTQCRTTEDEHFTIIVNKEDNEDSTTETTHTVRNYNKKRTAHRSEKQKNFRVKHLDAIRDWKRLPRVAKYKRKRVRQHSKNKDRLDREVDYFDRNQLFQSPDNAFDYIPSYRRGLKEIDYEYNPDGIQDVDNKVHQGSQVAGKKFKTEGDYSEEEDIMTSNILKKIPVKKTQNQFTMDNHGRTTEENDDDYDYSDLTDMENGNGENKFEPVVADYNSETDNDDVSFEEVDNDKLDIDEAAANNNKSEHDIYENVMKLMEVTTELFSSDSVVMSGDDMLRRNDQVLIGAYSHREGRANKKNKNNRVVIKSHDESEEIRGKRASTGEKHKRKKRRRRKRLKVKHSDESENGQFHEKPLTDQEKQDIFLWYNPDFQRWPRFVQDDQKFHEMAHRRGLEDYKKYVQQDFVKREDPIRETAASVMSENESELIQLQSAEIEDSSSTTSYSFSSDGVDVPASFSNNKITTFFDSMNDENKATSSEAEVSSNSAVKTLPSEATSSNDDIPIVDAVLVTANSDIFRNVTVPELGTQQGENGNNADAAIEVTWTPTGKAWNSTEFEVTELVSNSAEFQFNTTAEDLTQTTQCSNMTQGQIKPCEDENAKHNPGTVTSVLPLAKEAATESLNLTKEQFLDVDDILMGMLPRDVVVKSLSTARGIIKNGLKSARYDVNLVNFLSSTYNSSAESWMLFTEMSNLIKKLKYNTACQPLPAELKTYLKTITKNEMDDPMAKLKEMNEIAFDIHQSDYVFHSEQNDKIYEKAQVLRDLLRKYENLPPDDKKRVESVKKYIDSHLAMIEQMGGDKTGEPSATPIAKHSSTQPKDEKEISALEVDEEMKLQGNMKEKGTAFTSPQFGKLVKAVRNVRTGRQVIKRIGEIYGKNNLDKSEEDLIRNKDKGFESPRIINF